MGADIFSEDEYSCIPIDLADNTKIKTLLSRAMLKHPSRFLTHKINRFTIHLKNFKEDLKQKFTCDCNRVFDYIWPIVMLVVAGAEIYLIISITKSFFSPASTTQGDSQ